MIAKVFRVHQTFATMQVSPAVDWRIPNFANILNSRILPSFAACLAPSFHRRGVLPLMRNHCQVCAHTLAYAVIRIHSHNYSCCFVILGSHIQRSYSGVFNSVSSTLSSTVMFKIGESVSLVLFSSRSHDSCYCAVRGIAPPFVMAWCLRGNGGGSSDAQHSSLRLIRDIWRTIERLNDKVFRVIVAQDVLWPSVQVIWVVSYDVDYSRCRGYETRN
jgi:hypothetical protein